MSKQALARDRVLGARLRTIRQGQNLSLERAAELAQWSPSTQSRIETGKRKVTVEDVATLLAVYRVSVDLRTELIEMAKAGNSAGWWDRPLPGVPRELGALVSYEAGATALTDWSVTLIPGLLQTHAYAAGFMIADGVDPMDVETRWMARLRRQEVLGTVDYTAYVGEAALGTPFGGAQAFSDQLGHLSKAYDRGVLVRIVPERQAYAALLHSWLLMEFSEVSPVVHVELMEGGVYLHDQEVKPYFRTLRVLDDIALSPAASRDMVRTYLGRT
ncbi:helix-turn-helix domain-containing protein [Actinokineospora sp. 24-640]